jgi:hypothetical protein
MARYFIHRPAIWVFGGLLGIPAAMLQSESGALHHLYLRRKLIMNIAARFRTRGVCCRMSSSPRREAAPGTLGPGALIKMLVSAATG